MRINPPLPPEDLEHVLEKTERLWEQVRGRRIFITGGTGFFGCWLLESFLAANRSFDLQAAAVVLTRSPANFLARSPHLGPQPGLEFIVGDVRDFEFPQGEFGFVIHAAAETISNNALDIFSTIVDGTRRVLDFAQASGASKFLLTSSGAVYGRQPASISHIPEDYPGAPTSFHPGSAYGEGKRAAETLCAIYSERTTGRTQVQSKIARCFAFAGPHLPLDAHFAIGNFIRDAMAGGPIAVHGDGTPMRSYLYAADLAVWLWTILFDAPAMRPFNLGSDHSVSIRELAQTVAAALDPSIQVRIAQSPSPGAPLLRYVPSIERARTELGLKVSIDLAEAIRRTAAWHGFQPR